MPSYWDRFSGVYTGVGRADFWLKHRLRLIEGLSGRVLEACCGGGQLVLEMLRQGIDAYGIDRSEKVVTQSKRHLEQAGFDPTRIARGDVTELSFPNDHFDAVVVTGAIGLFQPEKQQVAIREMARVTKRELRLLEPFEKRPGLYSARVLGWMFDGQHPIPLAYFTEAGLVCRVEWDILWGVFSFIYCTK
ncbi:MAG: class I SAM-dependent methyltransferase [Candidatus Hadarchaeum sp.]